MSTFLNVDESCLKIKNERTMIKLREKNPARSRCTYPCRLWQLLQVLHNLYMLFYGRFLPLGSVTRSTSNGRTTAEGCQAGATDHEGERCTRRGGGRTMGVELKMIILHRTSLMCNLDYARRKNCVGVSWRLATLVDVTDLVLQICASCVASTFCDYGDSM